MKNIKFNIGKIKIGHNITIKDIDVNLGATVEDIMIKYVPCVDDETLEWGECGEFKFHDLEDEDEGADLIEELTEDSISDAILSIIKNACK